MQQKRPGSCWLSIRFESHCPALKEILNAKRCGDHRMIVRIQDTTRRILASTIGLNAVM